MRTVSVGIRNVRFIAIKRRRTKRTKSGGAHSRRFSVGDLFSPFCRRGREEGAFFLFSVGVLKNGDHVSPAVARLSPLRDTAGTHGFLSVENRGIRRHLRIAKEHNCKEKHSFSGLLKKRATIFTPRIGVPSHRYADRENRRFARARHAIRTCVEKINKNEEKQKNLGGKY